MKTENWNGHNIRFVDVNGEWWAVLGDVASALTLRTDKLNDRIEDDNLSKVVIKDSLGRNQETSIINEFGIYEAVFSSRKPQARDFKRWVFSIIKDLREKSGLQGFEVFRTLDKEHQRKMMNQLNQSLSHPVQINFIKANIVANKAVSTKFGYSKMVKKGEMTPDMLKERENILEDTVSLMALQDKYHLNLSVSQTIYNGLIEQQQTA
ncbi:BRO-N domain-containing protein [Latilactobacillus sakei]|uniref:BRO-N domain-containing protein n=1 Tax=Latilactobacillus sakei TaxID=1599 RepID=UPI001F4C49A3|nr:BRO family protein [Latilactobacillus sakei]UNC20786.1 phage repressor protein [Latilactobacillus sakei]